ncbi:MAG TPA: DMT family transporter [Candidatus Limnocylindrales bacterium]
MDRRLVGLLLIVASAAGFGSGALFARSAYEATSIGFATLMAWRFILGAAATWLWILASPRRRAAARAMDRRMVAIGLGLGILYVGNSGTYYAGLEHVPASLAALIVFVYPAMVAVLSLRFGRRLEGRRAWAALGLAVLGSILTIGGIRPDEVPPPEWLALVALSPIIYSCWIVLQAWLTGERSAGAGTAASSADPTATTAILNSGAAIVWVLLATAIGQPVAPWGVPGAAWPDIAGIAILTTFVAIVGFTEGSRRIGAAEASLISTIEPVWTIALAALLLGESLTPVQLAGGALILGGVILAQTGRRRAGTVAVAEARAVGTAEAVGSVEPVLVRIADE